ncbi:MAG TPA: FHA domain-containing protein [Planctomycetaceae bacterium]|nr:FHA domain-containing protein [Planctomycetaceae bacterium]
MIDLVIQGGKQNGKRLSLPDNKSIVVGREEGCQLVLNSTLISRRHCELKQTTEGVWVSDLGSQNGTYVNEIPITEPTLLASGDTVRIGPLVLEAQASNADRTGATSPPQPVPMVTPKPRKDPGLSDDEIAAWLGEGTPDPKVSKQDTVVYESVPMEVKRAALAGKAPEPKPAPTPPAKKFRSVKEEAADIIRRHWAQVRGTEPTE